MLHRKLNNVKATQQKADNTKTRRMHNTFSSYVEYGQNVRVGCPWKRVPYFYPGKLQSARDKPCTTAGQNRRSATAHGVQCVKYESYPEGWENLNALRRDGSPVAFTGNMCFRFDGELTFFFFLLLQSNTTKYTVACMHYSDQRWLDIAFYGSLNYQQIRGAYHI